MYQLEREQKIKKENLNQEQYFQSLFGEVLKLNLLDDDKIQKIQLELANLLTNEVERYTGGESSSVPIEKAKQIFQSICYNISIYLKTVEDIDKQIEQLKEEKLSDLFYRGMELISSYYKDMKSIWSDLASQTLSISNIAYHDTINTGLPEFFHDYEYEFSSQESAGSIDYPLCTQVRSASGIEFMKEYLEKLKLENDFCRKFSEERVGLLLESFHPDSNEMMINLYELVLTNALGCILLGQNIHQLDIKEAEVKLLQKNLEKFTKEELLHELWKAFDAICIELNLESNQVEYGKLAIIQIAQRLKHNLSTNTLNQLFISFKDDYPKAYSRYESGIPMEDEKLREFIDEVKECRLLKDKLELIQREVRSLDDFVEAIEECFYGDELFALFELLSADEIGILINEVQEEKELVGMRYDESLKEWQIKLLEFKNRKDD